MPVRFATCVWNSYRYCFNNYITESECKCYSYTEYIGQPFAIRFGYVDNMGNCKCVFNHKWLHHTECDSYSEFIC